MNFRRTAPLMLVLASASASAQPAAGPAPAVPEEGVFTLRQGATTILTEHFRRTGDRVEADITLYTGARAVWVMSLNGDGSASGIELRQYAADAAPDAEPAQIARGTIAGGRLRMEIEGAPGAGAEYELPAGAVVYVNPSPSAMEQIVRRARALGGDRVEVPVWAVDGAQATTATVAFEGAEARLTLADVEVVLAVDGSGRVLGGTVPSQGLTIERD